MRRYRASAPRPVLPRKTLDYLAEPVSGVMHNHDDALDARWVHPRDFRKYEISQTLVDLLKKIDLYPEF